MVTYKTKFGKWKNKLIYVKIEKIVWLIKLTN